MDLVTHNERAGAGMGWVIPLERLTDDHRDWAGGKAVNLGRLLQARLPVPPGFCVGTGAFMQWMTQAGAERGLPRMEPGATSPERRVQGAADLRKTLAATPFPDALRIEISTALAESTPDTRWAVRSSATTEDLPDTSFAGQHDSFLNVRGTEAVLEAVRQCWLSLLGERACAYRLRHGIPERAARMAVILQQMVPADLAGVLFTADPISGEPNRVVVEGAGGLGEALVSGRINPQRVVLNRPALEVLERTAGGPARNGEHLDAVLAHRLAKLGLEVERLFGGPQDLEWAVSGGRIFVLQARPITGPRHRKPNPAPRPPQAEAALDVWSNLNVCESFPEVLTPMSWSVTQFFLIEGCFAPLLGHLGLDLVQRPCLGLVAGRAYLNLSLLGNLLKMMPPLLTPDLEEVLGGQQRRAGIIQPRDLPGTGPRAGFRLGIRLLGLAVRGLFYLRRRSMDRFHEDLRRRMDDLDQTDLAALSDAALVEFVPGIARRILPEIGSTAFTARTLACFLPRLGCVLLVGPLCRLWLSPEDGAVSTQLLRGAGLMASAESGLDLWRLATWVRAHPALAQRLLETPSFAALETCWRTIPNGSEFKERWQSFLARHGHHARGELDIYSVRWREQPDYVLDLLRQYLRAGPDTDPVRRHTDALRERQALLNRYEQRLRNPLQRWTLRFCIEQGRRGVAFRENIKSEAVRGFGMVRRALFEVGARLTQRGVLRARDEVFFLHLEELRPLLLGPGLADLQAILTARQAEHARLRRLNPPPVVAGPFDPDHPVHLLPDAEATSQPQPAHTVDGPARLTLNGVAVSPGVVTGPARVILHADAQTRVLPGEILVACFTDPGWTPYFLTAAGLVTDLGGQLSHGSIVAREYGLPAVVNTAHATQVIQTGQLLRVDGNRGVVEVL